MSRKNDVQNDNDCLPELTKDRVFRMKLKQDLDIPW